MKTSFRKCVVAVIFGFSSGIAQNGNWEAVRGPLAPPNSYEGERVIVLVMLSDFCDLYLWSRSMF
jgi:hypothetical protein